jgi:hypothetical protein
MTENINTQPKAKYKALSIARYLFSLDREREYFAFKKMTNEVTLTTTIAGSFRLNQILYLLQIFYYIEHKHKELLFSDNVYAWESGMVIYSVHTHF